MSPPLAHIYIYKRKMMGGSTHGSSKKPAGVFIIGRGLTPDSFFSLFCSSMMENRAVFIVLISFVPVLVGNDSIHKRVRENATIKGNILIQSKIATRNLGQWHPYEIYTPIFCREGSVSCPVGNLFSQCRYPNGQMMWVARVVGKLWYYHWGQTSLQPQGTCRCD